MELKAAYIVDEVRAHINEVLYDSFMKRDMATPGLEMKFVDIDHIIEDKCCGFVLNGFTKNKDPLPVESVLYNIVSRGLPTKCPFSVSEVILKECFGSKNVKEDDKDPFVLNFKIKSKKSELDLSPKKIEDELLHFLNGQKVSPWISTIGYSVRVAWIQKTLASILSFKQNAKKEIKIYCDLSNQKLVQEVISDFNQLIESLSILKVEAYNYRFIYASEISKADYVICFDKVDSPNHFFLEFSPNTKNKFLYNTEVKYKALGVQELYDEISDDGEAITKTRFEYNDEILEKSILYLLRRIFRFKKLKPGQANILSRVIQKKDVIGLLPTGGGKSLTYQLCGLLQPGITVVVDPINSLMKDQMQKLVDFGMNQSAFINSMLDQEARLDRIDNIFANTYQSIFISPERFHIREFREAFRKAKSSGAYFHYVVIDEAHVVSEWGHDFRPSYLKLPYSISKLFSVKSDKKVIVSKPCFLGLTATASFDVLADVQRELSVSDEIQLDEDCICSLPPDAIDRQELSFKIIPVDYSKVIDGKYNPLVEFKIAEYKYPILLEKLSGLVNSVDRDGEDERYKGGVILFCPTKSFDLPNGVNFIKRELLNDVNGWSPVTYHGGSDGLAETDQAVIRNSQFSGGNMEKFLDDRSNLMICTKGFGMGIDKGNIRSTIHYAMPPSIESFYQEAGRAGRDKKKAHCFLLYDRSDVLMNRDFLKNSFKTEKKEIHVGDELLNEIRYETGFFINLLCNRIRESCGVRIKLNPNKKDKPEFFFINGEWIEDENRSQCYGRIMMNGTVKDWGLFTVDKEKQESISSELQKLIKEYVLDRGYTFSEWITRTSVEGLMKQIENLNSDIGSVYIGFINDYVGRLSGYLQERIPLRILEKEIGLYSDIDKWKKLIYRAYEFAINGDEFYENLVYALSKIKRKELELSYQQSIDLANSLLSDYKPHIVKVYRHIRNLNDTERAIYRLILLGVIEDYEVNYSGMYFEVFFKKYNIEKYKVNLKNYFKRYLGRAQSEKRANFAISKLTDTNSFIPLRDSMIVFVHEEIASKRNKAITFMSNLCEEAIRDESDKEFRTKIKYYFTSKFLASEYLPLDTDDGKYYDLHIVAKYLDFIKDPPNGLGGPIDNFKHLRGACERFITSSGTEDNYAILVLNAVSVFALEASRNPDMRKFKSSSLYQKTKLQFVNGFSGIGNLEESSIEEVAMVIDKSLAMINDSNLSLEKELKSLKDQVLLSYLLTSLSIIRKNLTI